MEGEKNSSNSQLQITSYNILADQYTKKEYFPLCEQEYLNFSYRYKQIIEQIQHLNSDIFCLQEVDWFEQNYRWEFYKLGYESIFNAKRDRYEGLVTLYKKDLFQLKSTTCFNLSAYIPNYLDKNHFGRNQILQISELIHLPTQKEIIVCNIHLYCGPQSEEIMMFQLLTATQIISEKFNSTDPILFCGDFNATPSTNMFNAIIYDKEPLLERIELKFQQTVRFQEEVKIFNELFPKYKIKFYSSYYNYKNTYEHPEFTNFTSQFVGCLDYIFYNKNMTLLSFQGVKDLPLDQIKELKTLPSKNYSSDHIPITSVFKIN